MADHAQDFDDVPQPRCDACGLPRATTEDWQRLADETRRKRPLAAYLRGLAWGATLCTQASAETCRWWHENEARERAEVGRG